MEARDTTRAQWECIRGVYKKLGHKGWFYPTMPTEYGGGGLTTDHDIIIKEELANVEIPPFTQGGAVAVAPLTIYGTEE